MRIALALLFAGVPALAQDTIALLPRTTFSTATGPVHLIANFAHEARDTPEGPRVPPRSLTVSGPVEVDERVYCVEN